MKVIVIGAGPTGLTLGAALAQRRHNVVAIDRDGGPADDGSWRRIGVMQFEHAHGFRAQVPELLQAEWPAALDAWLALGAEPIAIELPGGTDVQGMRSRRITYERALRSSARRMSGLAVVKGDVTQIVEHGDTVRGVVVEGRTVAGDLVVDASGRGLSRTGEVVLSNVCGISYVGRLYRRHEHAPEGPLTSPVSWGGNFDGYQAIVFPHEHRYFSVVIIRATADGALRELRHVDAFDAATMEIPALREWTLSQRSFPTSDVLLGGRPRNVYRSQRGLRGLVAVGDAVATTTPTAGRGVAMASMQIRALLDLLDAGADPRTISHPFDNWCETQIRPWVEDHIFRDDETVNRLRGSDIELDKPLTTTAIVDAVQVEPRIGPHLAGYLTMTELPSSLAPAEPLAREVYASGWRPPLADGPTRDELIDAITRQRHVPAASLAS